MSDQVSNHNYELQDDTNVNSGMTKIVILQQILIIGLI